MVTSDRNHPANMNSTANTNSTSNTLRRRASRNDRVVSAHNLRRDVPARSAKPAPTSLNGRSRPERPCVNREITRNARPKTITAPRTTASHVRVPMRKSNGLGSNDSDIRNSPEIAGQVFNLSEFTDNFEGHGQVEILSYAFRLLTAVALAAVRLAECSAGRAGPHFREPS